MTAYVGLPAGKIGITVGYEQTSTGSLNVTVSDVNEKSALKGTLFPGDIITLLNGKNVPRDETTFEEDIDNAPTFEHFAANEFVEMVDAAGDVRYMLITHDQSTDSSPYMSALLNHCNGRSMDLRVSTKEHRLGISVIIDGHENNSNLQAAMNRLNPIPQIRIQVSLRVSNVTKSSQLYGQIHVGDRITHVNGHLLLCVYPGEFVEIVKDIFASGRDFFTLTIQR